jgi:hypothetical protein
MEKNTFATSAYIAAPPETTHKYLCSLENLDEWTLGSRMVERVDDDTWIGTASGYQRTLYYHVRRLDHPRFQGIEWQCGYAYKEYFKAYPVLLFPPDYVDPDSDERGVYLHWVSVIDPVKRTSMIMEGIRVVHDSECRALKAALERRAGRTEAAQGRYRLAADTIYIDAPIDLAAEYVGDARTMEKWSHLLRSAGEVRSDGGTFRDEYDQVVEVTFRTHELADYRLVEQDFYYPQHDFLQRCPVLLIPCSHAFGDPTARGVLHHRITFWNIATPPRHGKLQIEDFGAESLNVKRQLEAKAGNLDTFARGMSYMPCSDARRPEIAMEPSR